MELALIPPFEYLKHTWDQKMHLLLPHLLANGDYANYAEGVVRDDGTYVIMDNGLAEGEQYSYETLVILAAYYQPDELVVPDTMGDRILSLSGAEGFLRTMVRLQDTDEYVNKLAFVAQGETVEETVRCAMEYMDLDCRVSTIMIPRRLVTPEQPHARLDVAERLHEKLGLTHVDIHLLGGSRFYPREVRVAAIGYPYIRSMDTSMPYVFAMKNYAVDTTLAPKHRDGDMDYWNWKADPFRPEQRSLLRYNIETMRKWASGK